MNIRNIFADNNLAIQKLTFTCGPVSLLNVLHLKGDDSFTEEEMAKICDAKPNVGTTNENLVKAAKKIGLQLIEEKPNATIEDIQRNIDSGAYVIACYQHVYSGTGHYSIISEYDNEAFYFRDCSYGLFRLEKEYFQKFWYGRSGVQQWYMAVK